MTSLLRSTLLFAVAAVAMLSTAATIVHDVALSAYASARSFAFELVTGPKLEPTELLRMLNRPSVELHRAAAFVVRIVKRDRPVVTASWRMAPSI